MPALTRWFVKAGLVYLVAALALAVAMQLFAPCVGSLIVRTSGGRVR